MLYSVILSALTMIFGVISPDLSWIYMIAAAALCLVLLWYAFKLIKAPNRQAAASLYKYSLLFLALFFVLVMVDSVIA